MSTTFYVGNLSYEVNEADLTQMFSQCGQVVGVKIIKDSQSNRSKGFGFVEMATEQQAKKAIEQMRGHDLKGRPLVVDSARRMPDDNRFKKEKSRGGNRRVG